MKFRGLARFMPAWTNVVLAILSGVLLVLAFPDLELWFVAWFGLVPLMFAVARESDSTAKSSALGWIFGVVFFTGSCWWLTFAPITYASFPPALAYLLLFCVTAVVGLFPALFAALLAMLYRRHGSAAILAAPAIWAFTEFLRYWLTGNNWNALGYAVAFAGGWRIHLAGVGGVYLVSAFLVFWNSFLTYGLLAKRKPGINVKAMAAYAFVGYLAFFLIGQLSTRPLPTETATAHVIAVQPDVPMNGLTYPQWIQLRQKHVALAEAAMQKLPADDKLPTTVIFPESPMNFTYDEDPEFQQFLQVFAESHDVNVLLNSAEPDPENKKYFNSAVLVDRQGKEIAQYDKIYLVPFGESVPAPLQSIVPAFVGSFSYGKKYELMPLGEAKAGVMICFESHFGQLSREFVRRGADVLVEMTNDGYLGPTPVLRQHLANAVFRAVETDRPVLRVTNVGITAYIDQHGDVLDPTESYKEATRVWGVARSDGSQTFYVRYGDWFAWLCSVLTIGLIAAGLLNARKISVMGDKS